MRQIKQGHFDVWSVGGFNYPIKLQKMNEVTVGKLNESNQIHSNMKQRGEILDTCSLMQHITVGWPHQSLSCTNILQMGNNPQTADL